MRFKDAYNEYLLYAKKLHKKQSFDTIRYDFKSKILPYFKDMYLDDINPVRNDLYHNLVKSNTKKELSYHVKHSNLTDISKASLLEMIRSK